MRINLLKCYIILLGNNRKTNYNRLPDQNIDEIQLNSNNIQNEELKDQTTTSISTTENKLLGLLCVTYIYISKLNFDSSQ